MDIIIRRAVAADFPAVYALFREFAVFQKTPEKLHITLDQLIADEAHAAGVLSLCADRGERSGRRC
jgi:diamine N-acetyltransferase